MAETQATVDTLADEARALAPSCKRAELDADLKARVHHPFETQARFLRGVISAFEAVDLAKYQPEQPKGALNGDGTRKPDKSNPWSAKGWSLKEQGRLCTTLGEAKALQIAQAAGCRIGSTRPNPSYN
jgi:hypothetical protein